MPRTLPALRENSYSPCKTQLKGLLQGCLAAQTPFSCPPTLYGLAWVCVQVCDPWSCFCSVPGTQHSERRTGQDHRFSCDQRIVLRTISFQSLTCCSHSLVPTLRPLGSNVFNASRVSAADHSPPGSLLGSGQQCSRRKMAPPAGWLLGAKPPVGHGS